MSQQAMPPNTPADISVFEDKGSFVLRSQDGQALYYYDGDTDGRPHCTGKCAETWPPVLASEGASTEVGEWKSIPRGKDRQWTYRGKPVYTYSKEAPGETKGNGVEGKWHLVSI